MENDVYCKRKVAIYARVSTDHLEQQSSLLNQIDYYDEIIKRHPDWELVDRYIDEGITGTSVKKRVRFLQMIKDAEIGKFDLLVTREVSRFARNIVDTLQQTRYLKKLGVEVYFTDDNIWTFNDEDGELRLSIMATLAQNESKKISQRVKAGQLITFNKGVFYGNGNILGYDRDGKNMVINQLQAQTVKFIYDLYLKGNGTRIIQYELEKRGMLTATGKKNWDPATITRILQNPFYKGVIVYRKSYIEDYLEQKTKINHGEVEKIIVKGNHEPIISEEDFDQVQKLFKEHTTKNKGYSTTSGKLPTTIWGKKLECQCGSTMNKSTWHKHADGKRTWCYQCYSQKRTGSYRNRLKHGLDVDNICKVKIIPEWKLNLIAYFIFDKLWIEKEEIIELANKLIDESIQNVEDFNNPYEMNIKVKKEMLEANNIKRKKLLDRLLEGKIDEQLYDDQNKDYIEIQMTLTKQIDELQKEIKIPYKTLEEKVKDLKKVIRDKFNYKKGYLSEELIDTFIDKVIVYEDHFNFYLNLVTNIDDSSLDSRKKEDYVLLGRLVITYDDSNKYSKYNEEIRHARIKEPLLVDLYM